MMLDRNWCNSRDREWCDSRKSKDTCIVDRSRPIPTLKWGTISAARSLGMATTAEELLKLKRILREYKTLPCLVCAHLGEKGKDPMETLETATELVWKTALSERHAVHRAATAARPSNIHGFILSRPWEEKPGSATKKLEFVIEHKAFTLPSAIEFIMVKLRGLFGGKSLAVRSAHVDACSEDKGYIIEGELTRLQVEVGAKSL